jgi:RHH-type proline utilization regulon transcriptional repressor/proline dehydrogenase/delta 1-pyrroline-5-carboxylate dehydrogenase
LQALTGKGLPLGAVDAVLDPSALESLAMDIVAFSGVPEEMRPLRQALARRTGAIVPLVSEAIYPAAYAHERAVCVDTTAAGGNASLLAMSS